MKNNKGLIIGIIGLIIVMIGGTYAYYRWNSTSNINVSVKISGNTVTFVGGSNVTGTLTPVDSKEEGIKKDILKGVSTYAVGYKTMKAFNIRRTKCERCSIC